MSEIEPSWENWNEYKVSLNDFSITITMGDWLQEGEYPTENGTIVIEKIRELNEEEKDKYLIMDSFIGKLWYNQLPEEEKA